MAAPSIAGYAASTAGGALAARQVTRSVTAGNLLIFCGAHFNAGAGYPVSPISDTGSNTWAEHIDLYQNACGVGIWSAVAAASGSITVTQSDTGMDASAYWVCLVEVSGQDSSWLDHAASGYTGWGNTLTVSALNNTTFAEDLVIGLFQIYSSGSWTPGTGFTTLVTSGAADPYGLVEYKTTSATGNHDPSASFGSSGSINAAAISIKGVSGGGAATSFVYPPSPVIRPIIVR